MWFSEMKSAIKYLKSLGRFLKFNFTFLYRRLLYLSTKGQTIRKRKDKEQFKNLSRNIIVN